MNNGTNFYRFAIDQIEDGSTYVGWLDLGFDIKIRKKIKLVNIKCHSTNVSEGQNSKKFVEDVTRGKQVFVKTFKDMYHKYACVLGIVFIQSSGDTMLNLNDLLIRNKLVIE